MVEVYAFHLMPYMDLPEDFKEKYKTSWVTMPNSLYDPEKAREYYHEYFDQLEFADRLGFDGVVVNEHHQTAYGSMPSPNLIAGLLAHRIKKAKIAILGNAISLHDIPQRVAEEVAILDIMTGGNRIISGFVRGIGAEYHSYRNVNPNDSKERFYEALDLIKKCWTEDGPFEFVGNQYYFPYVNVWQKPITKPTPPLWFPSNGSVDTIKYAAQNGYTYLQTLSSAKLMKESFDIFREEAEKSGYQASPSQLGWSHKVYVAETDARAWEEAEEHMLRFFDMLSMPLNMLLPPGYIPEASFKRVMAAKGKNNQKKMEQLVEEGYITIGSPETVTQRLTELQKDMGFGTINVHFHAGNMPHWKAMKNLDLFGRFVLPHIQKLGGPVEKEKEAIIIHGK